MNKTLYLAGRMRGIEKFNFPKFHSCAALLREQGWDVFNPAEHDESRGFDPSKDEPAPLWQYLVHDLPEVCKRDAIAMIPGWEESQGACIELSVARQLGKLVLNAETGKLWEPEPILDEAKRLVTGERQAQYGHPSEDFARTAGMWSSLFGWDVQAHQVAMAMICVKLSRIQQTPSKRDSWCDAAGYCQCGLECVEP